MIAMALNQGSSTRLLNPAAAIRIESRKLTRFVFPTIHKSFWDSHWVHQACLSYSHTEPNEIAFLVVHIKPTSDNKPLQKSIQIHWDRLHALNLTAIPNTYLQEGFHPRLLLQSQKRTFSMTLLATYSPSLSVQLCDVTGIDLLSTEEFYCTRCPHQSDLPLSTFLLCHC